MINLVWSGLLLLLLVSGCGFNGTPTRKNDLTSLTSIKITAGTSTIAAKTSLKLTATGDFSGLFHDDISDQVVWSSDTPTVAEFITPTIPSRVTAHIPGIATLTATKGNVSATFKLTVSAATINTVTITPANPTIAKGQTSQFVATGTFSDYTTQDLTFDADWVSSDPTVATVSNDPASKGFAQAIAVGPTTITATFDGTSGTTTLTVVAAVLQSIKVTTTTPTVLSLSTASFTAVGTFSDTTTQDLTGQVAWSSSSPGVASIVAGGVATTLAQGATSISASLSGVSGSTNLVVTGGNLTGIAITEPNVTLGANGITMLANTTSRFIATGTFSTGVTRDITDAVTWTVANTSLATVTSPVGKLVFLNAGAAGPPTTTIKASFGNVSTTSNLTVTPTLQSIAMSLASLNLHVGTHARLRVIGTLGDGTTQDLSANADWTSKTLATATVENNPADPANKGRVSGVNAAATPAVITASVTVGGTTFNPLQDANVTVTNQTLQSVTISSSSAVTSGNQVSFTATANYVGFTQNVTDDTTWSIDLANVAILADAVNLPGQVVGVSGGTAILTATFGSNSQAATVRVP